MAFYIAADIGGTAIKLGVLDECGRICARSAIPNPVREKGVDAMLDAVAAETRRFRENYAVEGLAVSTAGIVDENGVIVFVGPSFPGYGGTPVAQKLGVLCGLPCTAANDANCAALGEAWIGAGQDASPLVCVTLGTGVGGAVLIEGKPLSGVSGFAGEIGCLPFHDDILENTASVRALVRFVAEAKQMPADALDGIRVLDMTRAGDEDARNGVDRQMRALAAGIAAFLFIVNPEAVVIGGGIAAGADVLEPTLRRELDRLRAFAPLPETRLCFSFLGNDAGMVGALSYFLHHH